MIAKSNDALKHFEIDDIQSTFAAENNQLLQSHGLQRQPGRPPTAEKASSIEISKNPNTGHVLKLPGTTEFNHDTPHAV